jgi:hypothetical protein
MLNYQSSTSIGTHNTISSPMRSKVVLEPANTYLTPALPMSIWVQSSRKGHLLSSQIATPRVVSPTLDADAIARQLTQAAQDISSVEQVMVKWQDWGFECWFIVNQSTEDERFTLYDVQWKLMESFANVGFKFYVIERENRLLTEIFTVTTFDAVRILRYE